MATKRVLADKDFNRIIVRTHRLARNITMRVKPDGLHVTVPPYSLSSKVMEVVEQYRERLLQDWQRVCKKSIDLDFRIQAPCFSPIPNIIFLITEPGVRSQTPIV